jgi:hypothetical protein
MSSRHGSRLDLLVSSARNCVPGQKPRRATISLAKRTARNEAHAEARGGNEEEEEEDEEEEEEEEVEEEEEEQEEEEEEEDEEDEEENGGSASDDQVENNSYYRESNRTHSFMYRLRDFTPTFRWLHRIE